MTKATAAKSWGLSVINGRRYSRAGYGGFTPSYSVPSSTPGNVVLVGTNTLQSIKHTAFSSSNWWRTHVDSYGAGVFVPDYSSAGAYVIGCTGGHNHPPWPGASLFDFSDVTWKRVDPSGITVRDQTGTANDYLLSDLNGSPYYEITGTQVPSPGHLYHDASYVPTSLGGGSKGSLATITRAAVTGDIVNSTACHMLNLDTGAWSRMTTSQFPSGFMGVETSVIYVPSKARWYGIPQQNHSFTALNYLRASDWTVQSTATYSAPGAPSGGVYPVTMLDPLREHFVQRRADGVMVGFDLNDEASGWRALTVQGSIPSGNERWAFCHSNGAFYKVNTAGGTTLYKLIPPSSNPFSNTWIATTITMSQSLAAFGNGDTSLLAYGSLVYVPGIDCLAWFSLGPSGNPNHQVALIRP